LRRLNFRVAIEDLYDSGGKTAVCAAQHLRVNFPILARSPAQSGAIDDERVGVRRTVATEQAATMRAKATR
jgi:hypothetical protein